jgi:hypothetical protein
MNLITAPIHPTTTTTSSSSNDNNDIVTIQDSNDYEMVSFNLNFT